MIQHAYDNAESQLKSEGDFLDKFKCENLVKTIIRDKVLLKAQLLEIITNKQLTSHLNGEILEV